jgi:ABC-type branched-subunit amino acid transport system substrate-binding protein
MITRGVNVHDSQVLVAGVVSLSGRYARQGRQAAAGLHQAVADARTAGGVRLDERHVLPALVVLDDAGTRAGVRRALDRLAAADVIVGPYGSDLVREAAGWAAERGRVLWNHGGSADDLQRLPPVVSVASPTSRYLAAVLQVLARREPSARVLVVAGRGGFGRHAAQGAEQAAARLGMSVVGAVTHDDVPDAPDADVVLMAGTFAQDVALLRRLRRRPPTIAAVAGGLAAFADEVGPWAEGVLAPTQWEEGAHFIVDVGPRPVDVLRSLRARILPTLGAGTGTGHVEYPSAQAYAVVLVALHCLQTAGSLKDEALRAVARRLRCTTFFGRFGLGDDGRQLDHEILVVEWRGGVKRIVWPPGLTETELAGHSGSERITRLPRTT